MDARPPTAHTRRPAVIWHPQVPKFASRPLSAFQTVPFLYVCYSSRGPRSGARWHILPCAVALLSNWIWIFGPLQRTPPPTELERELLGLYLPGHDDYDPKLCMCVLCIKTVFPCPHLPHGHCAARFWKRTQYGRRSVF